MRSLTCAAFLLFAVLPGGCARGVRGGEIGPSDLRQRAGEPVLEIAEGRWFTGETFQERIASAVDGVLTFGRPAREDSTIDLAGGCAVPPFGEACRILLAPTSEQVVAGMTGSGFDVPHRSAGRSRSWALVLDAREHLAGSAGASFSGSRRKPSGYRSIACLAAQPAPGSVRARE